MKIRRDDQVQVISGDHAGSVHKVIQVIDGGKRLIVEGVNRVQKHVRRGHPKSPQGGRLEIELPIDTSNVLLYCNSCGKGTRTGFRETEDGGKERFCKACGGAQGIVRPGKSAVTEDA